MSYANQAPPYSLGCQLAVLGGHL